MWPDGESRLSIVASPHQICSLYVRAHARVAFLLVTLARRDQQFEGRRGHFQFLHTGDIHLDSPLKVLPGKMGRTATRQAFSKLVDLAIEEQVAFFPLPLFLHGSAALGWLFRQGLSGRNSGSLLRWPCGGIRFLWRRAEIDSL
jgi:hypothetical protein